MTVISGELDSTDFDESGNSATFTGPAPDLSGTIDLALTLAMTAIAGHAYGYWLYIGDPAGVCLKIEFFVADGAVTRDWDISVTDAVGTIRAFPTVHQVPTTTNVSTFVLSAGVLEWFLNGISRGTISGIVLTGITSMLSLAEQNDTGDHEWRITAVSYGTS